MKRRVLLVVAAGVVIGSSMRTEPTFATKDKSYKVVSVVDGDTIKVQDGRNVFTVRLIGIDAPETNSKNNTKKGCFAVQSRNMLSKKLLGKYVLMKKDVLSGDKDYYGRLLRYVHLGREDVGATMVKYGYAREYRYWKSDYVNRANYLLLQMTAKIFRSGLWNLKLCSMNRD